MHARCSLSVNSISLFLSHACSFPLTPSLFCAPSLSLPDSFFSITQTLRETSGVYLRLSHLYIEQFPPALLQDKLENVGVANQAKLKGDRCLGLKRVTTGVFLQKSAQLSLMPATQKPASLRFVANTAKEEEAVGKMEDEEEDEQKTEQGEKQEGKEEKEEEEEEGKGEEEDEPLFNSILFR